MNRKYLMVVLGIFFITIVLFFNEKNYKEPSQKDILKRFNYIENEIRKPFVLPGYSISSTVFAFCNAIKFQDFKVANKIKNLQKIGSKKRETEKFISYKTRFIDLEVNPLSESVLLFAETNQ